MRNACIVAALLAAVVAPAPCLARIKLAALPPREVVHIQLDHGAFTLVEEERIVPLLRSGQGNNQVDFSWSNTAIDKHSIMFRPVAIREGDEFRPIGMVTLPDGRQVPEVNVINVAYPPNENALVWEVYSAEAVACKVRVSYLISNFRRSFEYRAVADRQEQTLTLRQHMIAHNQSGEEFIGAVLWAGFGPVFQRDLRQQDDLRLLIHRFDDVPIEKTFTFDWYTHGALNPDRPHASRILMHYRLINDEENAMGLFPLQPGKARIFIADGRGGEAFLGEDWAALTPLDDTMRLFLGESRDIVCTRTIESNRRHTVRGNLHDQEIVIKYEIENFRDTPATLRIVEQLNRLAQQHFGNVRGDVEWVMGERTSDGVRFDYELGGATPTIIVDLPPRPENDQQEVEKVIVRLHVTLKNLW